MNLKTKKTISTIVILLLFIYISYLFFRTEFINEYDLQYENGTFHIVEHYIEDNEKGYIYKIISNDQTYNFSIFDDHYNKSKKLITKIYHYSDNEYACILPVFIDNKVYTNIICNNKEGYFNYSDIQNPSAELINFANSISEYNIDNYILKQTPDDDYTAFLNNVDYNMYVTNYKGYYNLKTKTNTELFAKDIYEQTLNYFTDKYYIIADYNQTYEFDKFYIIDLETNKKYDFDINHKISFDSYIQGNIKNNIYIYDKKNKKQYKIDLDKRAMEEVGNSDKGIIIYDGNEWIKETSSNCSNTTILFHNTINSNIMDTKFQKIDKYGNKLGYYYYYQKNETGYLVYKSNIDSPENKIFLFQTNTIDRITYYKNKIYYIDNNILKTYDDLNGIVNLFQFKEFSFNSTIKFGVYKK